MALMVAPTSLSRAVTCPHEPPPSPVAAGSRTDAAAAAAASSRLRLEADAAMSPTRVWILDSRMVLEGSALLGVVVELLAQGRELLRLVLLPPLLLLLLLCQGQSLPQLCVLLLEGRHPLAAVLETLRKFALLRRVARLFAKGG